MIESKKLTPKGEQLVKQLWEKGVDASTLAIVMLGNTEQLVGEVGDVDDEWKAGRPFKLFNPKRFLRLQQMGQGGLMIQHLIGDLDMMSKGEIDVRPPVFYRVSWMDPQGIEDFLGLYVEFLDRKVVSSAKAAGLVTPDRSPFVSPKR
jgi:hypothetical protein